MLAELSATYTALKAAGEIAKIVVAADKQLSEAELKMRLADMMGALSDARMSLASVQEEIDGRDAEIGRLKEALEHKASVRKDGNAYYEVDESGEPVGEPYCMHCYQSRHILRILVQPRLSGEEGFCATCKTRYAGRTILPISRRRQQT